MNKYEIVRYFNDLKYSDMDCKTTCPFYEECEAIDKAGLCEYITLHWEDINN